MQCVAVPDQGFIPGAYKCFCRDGYYFPNIELALDEKYFNGSTLETIFLSHSVQNKSVPEGMLKDFECLPCAEGCDSCVDDLPCLYSYSQPLRIALLALSVILLVFILVTALIVAISRKKWVRK